MSRLPMTEWWDEIKAAMNSIVDDISAIQSAFIAQKALILIIDVFEYWTKTIGIVNGITETRCINNGQS